MQASPKECQSWKKFSCVEDKIDERDTFAKENGESKNFLTQNIQASLDFMKRSNLRLIGIRRRLPKTENIFFNKNHKRKLC
jgi:hypothetical protein